MPSTTTTTPSRGDQTHMSEMDHGTRPQRASIRAALLTYLAVVAVAVTVALIQVRQVFVAEIDQRLLTAAMAVPEFLAADFHDRTVAADAISGDEDRANTAALSRYATDTGLSFVYSFIPDPIRPRLTASSATEAELEAGTEVRYYDPYPEALTSLQGWWPAPAPRFMTHTDRWGRFRAVWLPRMSPDNRAYLVGAELEISALGARLLGCMVRLLLFALALVLASVPLIRALTSALRENNLQLEQRVAQRTRALRRMATTDALTGQANRKEFLNQLDHELSRGRRHRLEGSLLMLDVDHFKLVNDTHGHPAGDRVLVELTRRVRNRLRVTDRLGRLGGEEFGVVLTHLASERVAGVAEDIRREVAAVPIELDQGQTLRVTLSIGVAAFSECDWDRDRLIHVADERLYKAKRDGRNRVVYKD